MSGAADPSLDHPGLLPAVLLGEPLPSGRPPRRSARDWAVDVVAFVLSLGSGALLLLVAYSQNPVPAMTVRIDVTLGVIACVLLWWRRRWPVQVAVATAALSAASVLSGFASVAALFTLAVHRRLGPVAAVAGLNLLAALAQAMIRPDPSTPLWLTIVIASLITAVAVAWGMFARARRQIVVSLRERAHRAEAEQQLRVSQARQLERTRIAREMHDVLAHRISLISLHAGALEFSAGATPDDVAGSAAVIRRSAHEALQDLREILGVLRTETPSGPQDADMPGAAPVERPQPTLADLPGLVAQSRSAGMRLTLSDQVRDAALAPTSLARTAFRVVQEGLTNAHKHAPHSAVTVVLDGGPGPGLDIEVRNRGSIVAGLRAAAPAAAGGPIPGAGQGLVGLVERTMLIGGRLEHGRTPDGDFRLHAWLPWPA